LRILSLSRDVDGAFDLELSADPEATAAVEVSNDLVTWEPLGGLTRQGSRWRFVDALSGTLPHRFYRLRSP
jgi:hypothetical protein